MILKEWRGRRDSNPRPLPWQRTNWLHSIIANGHIENQRGSWRFEDLLFLVRPACNVGSIGRCKEKTRLFGRASPLSALEDQSCRLAPAGSAKVQHLPTSRSSRRGTNPRPTARR